MMLYSYVALLMISQHLNSQSIMHYKVPSMYMSVYSFIKLICKHNLTSLKLMNKCLFPHMRCPHAP